MTMTDLAFKRAASPPKADQEMAYFFIFCENSIFIDEKEDQQVSIPLLKMDEKCQEKK
jgi:hypothetical protein